MFNCNTIFAPKQMNYNWSIVWKKRVALTLDKNVNTEQLIATTLSIVIMTQIGTTANIYAMKSSIAWMLGTFVAKLSADLISCHGFTFEQSVEEAFASF